MLDLAVRKVKGTQYKMVLQGWDIIGIFDNGKFFSKKGMTTVHNAVADKWHAETFKERLLRTQGV